MTRRTMHRLRTAGIVVTVVSLVWAAAIAPRAQGGGAPYAKAMFRALEWRSIGPARGGRSIAGAGVVGRPNEYYFGAVGGGLWKTTDGGTTWNPVTDGQIRSSSVGAVAVSESSPDDYRLNVNPLHVPPLRDRLEDIPILIAIFCTTSPGKVPWGANSCVPK